MLVCAYLEDLAPVGGVSWRSVSLFHLPITGDPLNGEHKGATSKDTIDSIDEGHQSCLLIVVAENYFAEEVCLHKMERCDFSKRDSCLVVPVAIAIDGVQC